MPAIRNLIEKFIGERSLLQDLEYNPECKTCDSGIAMQHTFVEADGTAIIADPVSILSRDVAITDVLLPFYNDEQSRGKKLHVTRIDLAEFRLTANIVDGDGNSYGDIVLNRVASNLLLNRDALNKIFCEKNIRVEVARDSGDEFIIIALGEFDNETIEFINYIFTNEITGLQFIESRYANEIDSKKVIVKETNVHYESGDAKRDIIFKNALEEGIIKFNEDIDHDLANRKVHLDSGIKEFITQWVNDTSRNIHPGEGESYVRMFKMVMKSFTHFSEEELNEARGYAFIEISGMTIYNDYKSHRVGDITIKSLGFSLIQQFVNEIKSGAVSIRRRVPTFLLINNSVDKNEFEKKINSLSHIPVAETIDSE